MIKNSVVLVPFPFDNFATTKVRPALCLNGEISKYGHVIIAFISSKIPDDLIGSDVILRLPPLGRRFPAPIMPSYIIVSINKYRETDHIRRVPQCQGLSLGAATCRRREQNTY
jgi:mRNA interferase MazF